MNKTEYCCHDVKAQPRGTPARIVSGPGFSRFINLGEFSGLRNPATKIKMCIRDSTISEPVDSLEISAMLYNLATEEQKKILETVYDVKPVSYTHLVFHLL